jgi:ribose 5-phosphate isomerase A
MDAEALKALVAHAALEFVPDGAVIGVGTGSTVNHFIAALGASGRRLAGAVSSSEASSARLAALGVPLLQAGEVPGLAVYIDGADEIDPAGCMIKGGGAALTREKIVADLAERFICIVDERKLVPVLGRFPLPVEVIPMALAQTVRRFQALGGEVRAVPRAGVVTDNGNALIDVHGLHIADPLAMETEFSMWPGVVTVGIFARHRASLALVGTADGVRRISYPSVAPPGR